MNDAPRGDRAKTAFVPPQFGTDGLRGQAGVPPLDPDTLRRVGAALGVWLQRHGPERKRVLAGHDGRDSASWILESLARGLVSADCAVVDAGLLTTPALQHLTRVEPFVAGVMISASHNPAADNGIKIFQGDGCKLPADAEREISTLSAQLEPATRSEPRVRNEPHLVDRYVEHLANEFAGLDLSGRTIVLDAANGGAAEIGPAVLRGLGADVVRVACEPDGFNINADCGALHPGHLGELVRNSGAVLGVCLDGDGDRCVLVDDRGVVHDGDDILATLGPWLRARGELPGDTVVTTVMSNLGLARALRAEGLQVAVTAVGDRHVADRMRERGFALGAEPSGHVLFDRGGRLVGDGLFTALTVLALPDVLTAGASRAIRTFERFPQVLVNVAVAKKPPLDDVPAILAAQRRIEADLGAEGRVILRYSGTEQLCRVMVEGPDAERVARHAAELAAVVGRELGG